MPIFSSKGQSSGGRPHNISAQTYFTSCIICALYIVDAGGRAMSVEVTVSAVCNCMASWWLIGLMACNLPPPRVHEPAANARSDVRHRIRDRVFLRT